MENKGHKTSEGDNAWLVQELEKGIELCLSSGKRLFDDAKYLADHGRYHSAIPLFILAYEEIGKAAPLTDSYILERPLLEKDLRKLFTGRGKEAHVAKNLVDHGRIDSIFDASDQEYNTMRDFAKSAGLDFPSYSQQFGKLMSANERDRFEKLHNMKMSFLYQDYDFKNHHWVVKTTYSKKLMKDLAMNLETEVCRFYHGIKLNLFMRRNRINPLGSLDEAQKKILQTNDSYQKLIEIQAFFKTMQWKEIVTNAVTIIKTF